MAATTAAPGPGGAREGPGAEPSCPERRRNGPGPADEPGGGLCRPPPPSTALRSRPAAGGGRPDALAVALSASADPAPAGLPSHPPRRLPHQAVLCPPPQESKGSTFPAKTGRRHTVANARALAVKQGSALSSLARPKPGRAAVRAPRPPTARPSCGGGGTRCALQRAPERVLRGQTRRAWPRRLGAPAPLPGRTVRGHGQAVPEGLGTAAQDRAREGRRGLCGQRQPESLAPR